MIETIPEFCCFFLKRRSRDIIQSIPDLQNQ
jgi:hypothetical protein